MKLKSKIKLITILLVAQGLLFSACTKEDAAEATVNILLNSKIIISTDKTPGDMIKLTIKKSYDAKETDEVWVDLNYNAKKDAGETVITFGKPIDYKLGASSIMIYGYVGYLDCSGNEIKTLEPEYDKHHLETLICSNNKIESIDVHKDYKLRTLQCDNNPKLTKINVANEHNNSSVFVFSAKNCPKLTCIQIDKGFTPGSKWVKDKTANWSEKACN